MGTPQRISNEVVVLSIGPHFEWEHFLTKNEKTGETCEFRVNIASRCKHICTKSSNQRPFNFAFNFDRSIRDSSDLFLVSLALESRGRSGIIWAACQHLEVRANVFGVSLETSKGRTSIDEYRKIDEKFRRSRFKNCPPGYCSFREVPPPFFAAN